MAEQLRRALPPADLRQPLTVLHLRPVLARRLGTSGTVGAILRRLRYGLVNPDTWSERTRAELERVFRVLLGDLQQFGRVRWEHLLVARSPAKPLSPPAITDAQWARLAPEERNRPPGTLHLRTLSMGRLAGLKINTLEELRAAFRKGSNGLPGIGARVWDDLEEALAALGPAMREDGSVDWLKYAAGRGFAILPEEAGPIAPGDYPARLVATIAAILENNFTPAHAGALDAYYLRLDAVYAPLRERAKALGVSIGQVSNWKSAVVDTLQAIFQRGDYGGTRFRLREEITAPLRELKGAFGVRPDRPRETASWERLIAQRWGADWVAHDFFQRLVPELLGVRRRGRRGSGPQTQSTLGIPAVRLLASAPGGLTIEQLKESLQTAPDYKDAAHLEAALRKSSKVFVFGDRFYLGSYKTVLADECERMLRRAARPLRSVELAWALQPLMPGRSLKSLRHACTDAMRADKAGRFRPGKGRGNYGLADWPEKIVPLAEAVAGIFRRLRGPLKTAGLMEHLRPINPVEEKELVLFLAVSPEIRRIGFSLWEWIGQTPETSAQATPERLGQE
jgi:hypothetical protein